MAFDAVVELSSLDGRNGFRIKGEARDDLAGWSVSSAGDVNGDGFDDVVVGAIHLRGYYGDQLAGASYVLFGRADGFRAEVSLSLVPYTRGVGFRLTGEDDFDQSGYSVSSAGDVNGDGFDDFVVGVGRSFDPLPASAYVVFGRAAGPRDLQLSALNGANGFRIAEGTEDEDAAVSVSSAGDVNGDGFADVLLGVPDAGAGGASYVLFGRSGGFAAELSLSSLTGANGFRIGGEAKGDAAGRSVSSAGDINGDGFDDLLIGAPDADPDGARSGAAYVVFGQANFSADLDLSTLDGRNGFRIDGEAADDRAGTSVSSAGDLNADGFDDLIVAARGANDDLGSAYVVFGRAARFGAELDLSTLNGRNGFQIEGEALEAGVAVASAGDVNGDGFDDLLVGGRFPGREDAFLGAAYVVFGSRGGFGARLDLATLDGRSGFRINGETATDGAGFSVDGAGDVNGDGFDDLIVGAPYGSQAAPYDGYGAAYVIFGQATGPLSRTGTAGNDVLRGAEFGDALRGIAGDDLLAGNAGDDLLQGGAGLDRLFGGAGNDRLVGGLGADALSGGAGADVFVFGFAPDSTRTAPDVVRDFAPGQQDRIDLRLIDADADAAGDQAFAFLGRATFTGAGGEVRFAFADGDTLVLADLDGDRRADLQVVLEGTMALTAADFLL